MYKSIVKPDRPQTTIKPMRIACWIPNAKNKHSKYITVIAFALQEWLHERASLLRYTYIVCLSFVSLIFKFVRRDSIIDVSALSSVAVGSSS
jgi:hypothetical protein